MQYSLKVLVGFKFSLCNILTKKETFTCEEGFYYIPEFLLTYSSCQVNTVIFWKQWKVLWRLSSLSWICLEYYEELCPSILLSVFFKEWNEALVKKLIFWISSTHTFQILCDTLKDFLKEGIISERKTLLFTSFLGLLKKSLEIKVGWGILEKLLWHQQVIFLRKSQKSFHKGGRLLWLNYPEQVYRTRHLLMCVWERSGFHFGQPWKLYEIS